jgi:propanol-preferring alcohol dehydrogenase
MVLTKLGNLSDHPLPLTMTQVPAVGEQDLLIRVSVCGVYHTDLDEIESRTAPAQLPVILGHQMVGTVEVMSTGVSGFEHNDRVGVAWIFTACGHGEFCRSGRENLCPDFKATGRDANGGYAEYMVVPAAFAYHLPDELTDEQIAPLLYAGAVGCRSLQLTGLADGQPGNQFLTRWSWNT